MQTFARLIGRTPLVAIDYTFRGRRGVVYAKLESVNFTGSIADRVVLHILRNAYERGELQRGAPIVEASSGNMGIALAAMGGQLGHPVTVFMPDWMSYERADLIRAYGGEVRLLSRAQGGFVASLRLADRLAKHTAGGFSPRQFSNDGSWSAHHRTTAPELAAQLRNWGLKADAFVAVVGTGGTLMGIGRFLRSSNPAVKLHPIEPESSPTLSTGRRIGRHRLQGAVDEFIPPIVNLEFLDDVIAVDDGDAILAAQKLAREVGLGIGISSGANFLGAVIAQERLGAHATVATVFADCNKKYLSTDLAGTEPVGKAFLSPEIEIVGFRSQAWAS